MKPETRSIQSFLLLTLVVIVSGCVSGAPKLSYPAYIEVDELPNVFVAGLPGARSKQLAGDPRTQRTSNRVQLPPDWQFTTGASPGQSLELFVLQGELMLGEFLLTAGGYAYIPPGSSGLQMQTDRGVLLLYFLDDQNELAVIQTPLITNSELINWKFPTIVDGSSGRTIKVLRQDPGSGARTWLARIEPGATLTWQHSSQTVEGYLLSGSFTASDCVGGKSLTGQYLPGGYFYRPPGAIHGGPESGTIEGAVWLMRTSGQESIETFASCQ